MAKLKTCAHLQVGTINTALYNTPGLSTYTLPDCSY